MGHDSAGPPNSRPNVLLRRAAQNYDDIATRFTAFKEQSITENVLGYPFLFEGLQLRPGLRLLDFGCGFGHVAHLIRGKGIAYCGVDASVELISQAQQRAMPGEEFLHIPRSDLASLKGRRFDRASIAYVMSTVPTLAENRAILEAVRRVMEPGGLVGLLNINTERSNGRDFISCAFTRTDPLVSGAPVDVVLKSRQGNVIAKDFHYTQSDYVSALVSAGWEFVSVTEPIAHDDGHAWRDEKEAPPAMIIIARNPGRPDVFP